MTSSFIESIDIPEETQFFKKICDMRSAFSLPVLRKNQPLKTVIIEQLTTGSMVPIKKSKNYTIVSTQEIYDSFENENIDQILNRWIKDADKRTILLSPGNYGAVCIKFNKNSDHSSGRIAFRIALIYRDTNLNDPV